MNSMLEAEPAGRMRQELQEQELMLRGILSRLAHAREDLLPRDPGADWTGPASLLYRFGLDRLRGELALAQCRLNDALRETQRAISSMGSRGG